jgi:hypothetical protein
MAITKSAPDLYIVVEAFVIPGKGAPQFYRKGDIVAASDPGRKVRPSAFRVHTPRGLRVEQATAAPGEVRG